MLRFLGFSDLFDHSCVLCGLAHKSEFCLCQECLADLPANQNPCQRCGCNLPQEGVCGACLNADSALDKTVTAFQYHYPLDLLVKNIKYKQELSLLPVLSVALVEKIKGSGSSPPEALLPVPLYITRLYARGYNQSLEICKILSRELGIACDPAAVKRIRNTPPMSLLAPAARRRNVRGAFEIGRPFRYKSVAIVDDVVTSGATAETLAKKLKANGVQRVELWSLARA